MSTPPVSGVPPAASAEDPPVPARGAIARLLLAEGVLTEGQLRHAERVRAKLGDERAIVEILKELYEIGDSQIRTVLQRHRHDVRLGDLLVELGHLRQEYLDTALAIQRDDPASKKRIGELLVEHHFIEEAKLAEVLALHLGFPLEAPDLLPIPADLLANVPLKWCEQHDFVPIRAEEGSVVVAFADPTNAAHVEAAGTAFGNQPIVVAIASRSAIRTALDRIAGRAVVGSDPANSPVVGIVNDLIEAAIDRNASDIHIEPRADRLSVRFREDGVLVPFRDLPRSVAPAIATRIKVLCQADITERRRHQGGRFLYTSGDRGIDFRVSIYVTVHGEKIVLRLLNQDRRVVTLAQIGMAPRMLERFRDEGLDRPSGVLIITGPTGSGKTTTLYACVGEIKNDEISIITAEDPVEYVMDGVSQCSLNPAIDLTFEETLRHIVRQDPDVIVIGEIRDKLSAETAIQAALTGHKVLTTFHTEDSIGGLLRLLNMDIEAFLVSSTVVSIVAQRLLRRICDACAVDHPIGPSELRRLGVTADMLAGGRFRIGNGCEACRGTGYRGRLGAFELLILNGPVRDAILERRTGHEIRRISRESNGLVSLFEDGLVKAASGFTSIREVIRLLPRLDKPRPLAELRRLLGVL